ncbi:MAG: hypothetical protein GY731_05495 [Gammaproteobacteria bacterium]|nr:hypothetical protein [Gammaproteobacteria bacterium]
MTLSLQSRFSKSSKQVLYLSGHQLTAYQWRRGELKEAFLFQAGEEGLLAFSNYLQETRNTPAYILLDVVEEEYRRDTIPHVFSRDRRDLIRRRAERLFRETPYWHTVMQGREKEGRRDDIMLFTALINPGLISPWLERLKQLKVPLAGIYSLPLLSANLLPYLAKQVSRPLLVSLHSGGGLRQTFFHDRDLKVSRLAHMSARDTRQVVESILDEVEKLRRYLNSLRLLGRNDRMDVYILANGDLFAGLNQLSKNSASMAYHIIEMDDLAARMGMNEEFVTPHADAMFANLLARKPPANHYALAEETGYYLLHHMRKAMMVATMVVMLGGLTWGGSEIVDGLLLIERSDATLKQTAYYQRRYDHSRKRLPDTPAEPRNLKKVFDAAVTLEEQRASPLELMRLLSAGLVRFPGLLIERIEWKEELASNVLEGRDRSVGVESLDLDDQDLVHVAKVEGRVSSFDGNYRRALEMVRAFAETMRSHAGIRLVEVISLPLNVSSHESLKGDVDTRRIKGKAGFSLQLIYRKDNGKN